MEESLSLRKYNDTKLYINLIDFEVLAMIRNFPFTISILMSPIIGTCIFANYLLEKYPPIGSQFKWGSFYNTSGKKFIGYTGHRKDFKLDNSRDLYFTTRKKTAQSYAGIGGQVWHVIGKEAPRDEHYGKPHTSTNLLGKGTYTPLSPQGIKTLNVEVVDPEQVTNDTEIGIRTSFNRWLKS